MQRLEVSGAVRPIYGSLGVKRLITTTGAHSSTYRLPSSQADLKRHISLFTKWFLSPVVSTEETALIDASQMFSGQGVDPTSLLRRSEGV